MVMKTTSRFFSIFHSTWKGDFLNCLRRKSHKKAQMKIQQTAFMLLAVTLFFVLVGLFILTFKFSGLKETAALLQEENAMLLVTKLANSPEFSCGGAFGANKGNCIDADKVMALKENINDYSGFWGVSNIEIRKIYPEAYAGIECTKSNYPNCDIIQIRQKKVGGYDASNFVSLCRKESFENNVYDKCELARIMISYEVEQ